MTTRRGAGARVATEKLSVPTRVTRSATRNPTVAGNSLVKPLRADSTKVRKPLTSRNDSPPVHQQRTTKKPPVAKEISDNGDRVPIRAFLRIRPNLGDPEHSSAPYLKFISSTTVQMTDPSGTNRIRLNPQTQVYTFNHVFPSETLQAEFFEKTTLPLVQNLLSGQNGLVFTYGVTNSGKTYTIQGGSEHNSAGLLPRTLDVVFNSIEGSQSDLPYRPVRLDGIEHGADDDPQYILPDLPDEKVIADVLGEINTQGVDQTALKVDKNHEYAIWISYAEVYNEKVYDLLSNDSPDTIGSGAYATPQGNAGSRPMSPKKLARSTSTWQSLSSLASSTSNDVLLVKRKALTLKNDAESGGKYVSGLRCICVHSAEEAKRIFRMGNINRRVFGTLANAASSRSHGIFTLRVVRVHKADHSDVAVSRLSIVDLAGSERTKNTQNTGERLKEAGSINKSLMVLGQCMDALRNNQKRLAASLAVPGRGVLRSGAENNTKLAIVPFRHSKLTELFQDFFVGEHNGHACMIVNVNPYDTGFDENSHVMRFAALAREVTTVANAHPRANSRIGFTPTQREPPTGKRTVTGPHYRKVTISTNGTGGRKASEAHLEIVEEDEEPDDDDNEPTNPLIDTLFEEIEELRIKLYESEMRSAVIEAETREEVMIEMEERMMNIERIYAKRLMQAVEQSEAKTDAKIDMLHQFGAFNPRIQVKEKQTREPISPTTGYADNDLSGNSSCVLDDAEILDDIASGGEYDDDFTEDPDSSLQDSPVSPSPLQPKITLSSFEKKKFSSGPQCIGLREEDMKIDEIDADETMTIGEDDENDSDDEVLEDTDQDSTIQDVDDDEWIAANDTSPAESPHNNLTRKTSAPSQSRTGTTTKAPQHKEIRGNVQRQSTRGLSQVQRKMNILSLSDDSDGTVDMSMTSIEDKENSGTMERGASKRNMRSSSRTATKRASTRQGRN